MSKGNEKKRVVLGMPIGTASSRLKKTIMFSLICRLKENVCFQCGGEILIVDDLSVEHKQPWIQADDPVESFFDLENIAFSHLSCNIGAATKPHKRYADSKEKKRAELKRAWNRMSPEEKKAQRRKRYERYGY